MYMFAQNSEKNRTCNLIITNAISPVSFGAFLLPPLLLRSKSALPPFWLRYAFAFYVKFQVNFYF